MTVRITPDLKRQADVLALLSGMSLNALINRLLQDAVATSDPALTKGVDWEALAARFNTGSPSTDFRAALREASKRLGDAIEDAPDREPGE
jgi:hypothetical protein